MTGKLRAAWAEVGKDANPYAYAPSLEFKLTSYGGYGTGFTGPNPNLRPEFATSMETGVELAFFDGRLGLDATIYRKETRDQIVQNVRASYGSGYILINLNGAETRSEGLELTLRGTPLMTPTLSWDVQANFTRGTSKVLRMPSDLPEYYSSDTWLYGNVRNGVAAGLSTMSLTGYWFQRNQNGDLLIDPTTGLPIRDTTHSGQRLRPCTGLPDRPAQPGELEALQPLGADGHPQGRRRLQRHRALADGARAERADTGPLGAARGHRRAPRRQGEHGQPDAEHHRGDPGDQQQLLPRHERGTVHREGHQLAADA
jgi:hypothetical protein